MTAELQVQSPRLLNRRINFLRYTKPVAEGQWAVMDVSVDGILGPPGSRIADAAVANNTVVPASYTGWRLLPSGCLVEDMPNGYCKASAVLLLLSQSVNSNVETLNFKLSCALQITWVVHAEYDEATVPTMFRPLFRSGKALGAHRWLASLQRQCEYLAVLHSSQAPRGDNTGQSFYGQQGNCPYITSYGLISWEQLSDIHIYIGFVLENFHSSCHFVNGEEGDLEAGPEDDGGFLLGCLWSRHSAVQQTLRVACKCRNGRQED
jgi:homeobox-leucine zipper protein